MTNQDRKRIAVYSIKSAGGTVTAAALAILNAQNGRETTLVDPVSYTHLTLPTKA